jgi:hypothetical protein
MAGSEVLAIRVQSFASIRCVTITVCSTRDVSDQQ